MGRSKVDKTVCRVCRRGEPQITLLKVSGASRGICASCRRHSDRGRYHLRRSHRAVYRNRPNLVAANYNMLSGLKPGIYGLHFKPTQVSVDGFIVVRPDAIFVKVWNQSHLFHYDLFGLALYLGNQNVLATTDTINVVDLDGHPLTVEQIIGDRCPSNVSDSLVLLDPTLRDYAIKAVKAEIASYSPMNLIRQAEREEGNSTTIPPSV